MVLAKRVADARGRVGRLAEDSLDKLALQQLAPLTGSFLPWTEFSMRPASILAVVSDIAIHRREVIVECGSGNSTIYAARVLAQYGIDGHVHSIDHDPAWAELTAAQLERDGLERFATVTCAPLVDGWYDRRLLPTVNGIDLLVVDGPPANLPHLEMARAPALEAFRDRLKAGATIILDDADRPGEQRVIARWREQGVELHRQRGRCATAQLA